MYAFSGLGIVALIGTAIWLASNEKTGQAVVLFILALILLVILVQYKNVLRTFFVKE